MEVMVYVLEEMMPEVVVTKWRRCRRVAVVTVELGLVMIRVQKLIMISALGDVGGGESGDVGGGDASAGVVHGGVSGGIDVSGGESGDVGGGDAFAGVGHGGVSGGIEERRFQLRSKRIKSKRI